MTSILQTFLASCAAICIVAPRWGTAEECAYDFAAELSIQVLNKSTQIPIDDDQNNRNGSLFVREGWLTDIELWGYRVDLRFRGIDKYTYEVAVVLQERTSPPDSSQMPGMYHHRNATYDQLNLKTLSFKGAFGKPLVIRPDIADVTLALTLYSYPREA
jgi:hypothetical protein